MVISDIITDKSYTSVLVKNLHIISKFCDSIIITDESYPAVRKELEKNLNKTLKPCGNSCYNNWWIIWGNYYKELT